MGILNSNKQADRSQITCDGTFHVTLSLTAAPNILENPTDIVLVLDRSGSMAGDPLKNVKIGANTFIDIIADTTNDGQSGQIGSRSRMGVVTFAATAIQKTGLITSVSDLKAAVDSMVAAGSTNHADAFLKAMELFDPASSNAKVIVMFTDGMTTTGLPPAPVAAEARAKGIIIYCIGLIGSDGLDVQVLNEWATDPDISHVSVTPDAADLEELFAELAANIAKPGATEIRIDEEVEPDFEILSIKQYSKGIAQILSPTTLRWEMDELGTTGNEGVFLEFIVQHVGQTGGSKKVNRSITYQDAENNIVLFPNPEMNVDCLIPVTPEPCPVPVELTIDGCEDVLHYDLGDVHLSSTGRLLLLDLTLRNICPGKRVGVAIFLNEVDQQGQLFKRGFKAFTVPPHTAPGCRDIQVQGISFVLPEDLNPSDCCHAFCSPRHFEARVFANYLDYTEPCVQN